MADAVTSQTLVDDEENVVMKFTNISDSTGESAVKKVDVSALKAKGGDACSGVIIKKDSGRCKWHVCSCFLGCNSKCAL